MLDSAVSYFQIWNYVSLAKKFGKYAVLDKVLLLYNEQYYIYIFIYLLQLGCYPVAVVILHVNKTWNWLLLDLSREGYMRSM